MYWETSPEASFIAFLITKKDVIRYLFLVNTFSMVTLEDPLQTTK